MLEMKWAGSIGLEAQYFHWARSAQLATKTIPKISDYRTTGYLQ